MKSQTSATRDWKNVFCCSMAFVLFKPKIAGVTKWIKLLCCSDPPPQIENRSDSASRDVSCVHFVGVKAYTNKTEDKGLKK